MFHVVSYNKQEVERIFFRGNIKVRIIKLFPKNITKKQRNVIIMVTK